MDLSRCQEIPQVITPRFLPGSPPARRRRSGQLPDRSGVYANQTVMATPLAGISCFFSVLDITSLTQHPFPAPPTGKNRRRLTACFDVFPTTNVPPAAAHRLPFPFTSVPPNPFHPERFPNFLVMGIDTFRLLSPSLFVFLSGHAASVLMDFPLQAPFSD